MENYQMTNKDMKVQIPPRSEVMSSTGVELQGAPTVGQGGLTRQPSMTKTNCLCSPTTHAGSFRCRLHRTTSLHRTKSTESESLRDQASMVHASLVEIVPELMPTYDTTRSVNKDRMH